MGREMGTCDTVQPWVAATVPDIWRTVAENKSVHMDK
jgi:hypothetical protein